MTSAPLVSVVIPTYREAGNLRELIARLDEAFSLTPLRAEFIIVDDDSNDGTEELVATLAGHSPVRLIIRRTDRGLSQAVLEGFRQARGDIFVVMDADLQHPPELTPALALRLQQGDCDFVSGSRYATGGRIHGGWSCLRRAGSLLATLPARPLTPLTDPLSGLFAIRRETWEAGRGINPIGYKIGLELYVKCGCTHPAEVPISFGIRQVGASKFGLGNFLAFLRHLARLYRFRFGLIAYVVMGLLWGGLSLGIALLILWMIRSSS